MKREAERQVPNGMFKPAAEQENVGGAETDNPDSWPAQN